MQAAPALIGAALALGTAAAILGLAWPRLFRLTGVRPSTLWIAAGLAIALAALAPVGGWSLLPAGAVLVFLALTDLRRYSLPMIGLAILAMAVGLDLARTPPTAGERLLAGGAALVAFLAIRHFSGKPPKLGAGDVVLAAMAAALIGWRLAPVAFALAALAPLALQRVTGRAGPAPFGFWLALATLPAAFLAG